MFPGNPLNTSHGGARLKAFTKVLCAVSLGAVMCQSALAQSSRVEPEPPAGPPGNARAERDAAVRLLEQVNRAQQLYFEAHRRFADTVAQLKAVEIREGLTVRLVASSNSWTAVVHVVSVPGMQCGVGVNAPNPVFRRARSGETYCVK